MEKSRESSDQTENQSRSRSEQDQMKEIGQSEKKNKTRNSTEVAVSFR